jgi:glycosyltransferase involved in cell wall biosynthesis
VDLPPRLPDRVDARELRLGYLGRLHPKKGLEEALAACQILDEQGHPGWTFTVAGKGEPAYEQQLARRARGLGMADRVKFLGQIDGPVEKQAFFAQLDMLLVPSHTENFGIVVAESLAHGVPVVASRGTPWSELEREGCGLWVDNDPESLANAIARLSRQPVREAGARGRAWMEREYGWAAAGAAMVRLYERLTTP